MTSRALLVGSVITVVCATLVMLPLLIPMGGYAKFLVAPSFVGACAGLSICANALLDRWRAKIACVARRRDAGK